VKADIPHKMTASARESVQISPLHHRQQDFSYIL